MPVQAVQLVGGHHVYIALGLLDGPEMPAWIHVHAPVGEAGLVVDGGIRQHPVGLGLHAAVNLRGQHLLQGFTGIQETVQGRCLHGRPPLVHLNNVLLCLQLRVHREAESAVAFFHGLSRCRFHRFHKAAYGCPGLRVHFVVHDKGSAFYRKRSLSQFHFVGHRDHLERLRLGPAAGKRQQGRQEKIGEMFHIR